MIVCGSVDLSLVATAPLPKQGTRLPPRSSFSFRPLPVFFFCAGDRSRGRGPRSRNFLRCRFPYAPVTPRVTRPLEYHPLRSTTRVAAQSQLPWDARILGILESTQNVTVTVGEFVSSRHKCRSWERLSVVILFYCIDKALWVPVGLWNTRIICL